MTDESPQPTENDRRNAATRASIAARQADEYGAVLKLAIGAFDPGWLAASRHCLTTKEAEEESRHADERSVVTKIVFTVKNSNGIQQHLTS